MARFAKPWIVAHRGANREAPENTRSAFNAALAYPIDGIELDVQLTRDGTPVLYHDRTLSKVTGSRKRVCNSITDELDVLDWGGWFHSDFAGEPLLRLKDALTEYASKTRLLIEIKSRPYEQRLGIGLRLTTRIVQLLAEAKESFNFHNIYILSFDPKVLAHAHRLAPNLNYVALSRNPKDLMDGSRSYSSRLFRDLHAVCAPIRALNSAVVKNMQSFEKRVMTYACNTPAQMKKALTLHLDVIMTDDPKWLFTYCKGMAFLQ
jgi:glycerophosphoryl diester phosphodiesterase